MEDDYRGPFEIYNDISNNIRKMDDLIKLGWRNHGYFIDGLGDDPLAKLWFDLFVEQKVYEIVAFYDEVMYKRYLFTPPGE